MRSFAAWLPLPALACWLNACSATTPNGETSSDSSAASDEDASDDDDDESPSSDDEDGADDDDDGDNQSSADDSSDSTATASSLPSDENDSATSTDESTLSSSDTGSDQTTPGDCDPSRVPTIEVFKERLESLTGVRPAQFGGQEVTIPKRIDEGDKANARAYLSELLEGMGFAVSEHKFEGSDGGTNLIADRPGKDPNQIILVSGHLDSMDCAGADDDASGILSAIAVLEALQGCELEKSLRFVAFDQEEKGLVGSKAYAQHLVDNGDKDKIVADYQLEMTGYDTNDDGKFNIIDCADMYGDRNEFLVDAIEGAVEEQGLALQGETNCTDRSDHASFWDIDLPAVVVSQLFFGASPDSNACYHQSCDTVENINYEYMHKLSLASSFAIAKLAGAK